uniref:Uncharacterized protein n=1 Tax=Siphoviridae sp. ct0Ci105 TaxID=2825292 RepID=A0A8S5P8K3_9CAUD|nr:MAG TPA: hypothetical protein [Siphoviridae sp. ct0Ci105]
MITLNFDEVLKRIYNAKKGVEVRYGLGQGFEYCKQFTQEAGTLADAAKAAAETAAKDAAESASSASTKATEAADSAKAASDSATEAAKAASDTAAQTLASLGLSIVDGALCYTYEEET